MPDSVAILLSAAGVLLLGSLLNRRAGRPS